MRELLILKKSKGGESMDRRQISTEKGKFRTREGGDEEDTEEDWKIRIEIEGRHIYRESEVAVDGSFSPNLNCMCQSSAAC